MPDPTRNGPNDPPEPRGLDDFFVAGGTLRPGTASYVTRPTDGELLELALGGEFCFVLTPRQMGKSSLMVRTAQRLKEQGVHTAIIDLTQIGTGIEVEQWYLGLLSQLSRRLRLATDPTAWWRARGALGYVQRFTDFLRDVVLTEVKGRVVIFIDEIDTTLKLDFRDDFFAAIRAMYNARADEHEFERLTFVLLGVASPPELIKDPARTPFNIGHAIALQEFSREDAAVLRDGLEAACPGQGDTIMDSILRWTAGHPYLTQKLCLAVAESPQACWTGARIDDLVTRLFLADEARRETNLQFVQDKILGHERRQEMLALYRKVLRGAPVRDDGQSQVHNHLKLSGLVKTTGSTLAVRNEIYRRAFDLGWVRENTAVNPYPIIIGLLAALILAVTGVLAHDVWAGIRFDDCFTSFYQSDDPNQRLQDLACAFRVRTVVLRGNYAYQAQDMFYSLARDEQLALIGARGASPSDRLVVVSSLYMTLADVDETDSTGPLLAEMARGLHFPEGGDEPASLVTEIEAWQRGRAGARQGRELAQAGQAEAATEAYSQALVYYSRAIDEADNRRENPATLYERARVLTALERYAEALDDLDGVAAIASRGPQPTNTPEPTEPPTPTVVRTATRSATSTVAATRTPRDTVATGVVASPLPLTTARFTATPGAATATTRESMATTTRTPTPEPTREPAEIQSRFSTVGQIVNAVRALINGSPGLIEALAQAPAARYPNLRAAGLVSTPTATPAPTFTRRPAATASTPPLGPGTVTPTTTALPSAGGGPAEYGLLGAFVENAAGAADLLSAWKPPVIYTVDLDAGAWRQFKAASPNTLLVARVIVQDQPDFNTALDPVQAARAHCDSILGYAQEMAGLVDYWAGITEPYIGSPEAMSRYAQFEAERARIMGEAGFRVAVGSFATGNPPAEYWEQFLPALEAAQTHSGALALHEYSWPTLDTNANRSSLRHRQVYDGDPASGWTGLPADLKELPLIITEAGLDGLIEQPSPPRGWRDLYADTPAEYLQQLSWYDSELKNDSYVLGAALFGCMVNSTWASYDICPDLAQAIAQQAVPIYRQPAPLPTLRPIPTRTPTLTALPVPATYARVGVVGRNAVFFDEADYQLIRDARIETIQLWSFVDPTVFERIRRENPDIEIIVTLYDDRFGVDSRPSPAEFISRTVPIINQLQPYATKFEILHEPNHAEGVEGWGATDEDAQNFRQWYLEALARLREACPWASFGFPGLAPGEPHRDLEWLAICRDAVEASDWLGSHNYWQFGNMLNDEWGLRFERYHKMFPDKPIQITQFGNSTPNLPRRQVAEQYVQYYQELAKYPYVRSASAYIMSSPDAAWDLFVWRTEDGEFYPVVDAVGNMERPSR